MKPGKIYLLLVLFASFLLPYIVCSAMLFPDLTFITLPAPKGMMKTLLVLAFLASVIALLPVLPLVLLNLVPPLLAFVYLKFAANGGAGTMLYTFVAYHVLFAITIYFTWKSGRAMFRE